MAIVPRLTRKLIDRAAFAAKNPYYIMEGGSPRSLRGFGVRVHRSQKHYVVRFRRKPHFIGRTDVLPLSSAREKARALLLQLLDGKDPAPARYTVETLSRQYQRRHAKPHKSKRSAEDDERMWRLHVLPVLGKRFVREITSEDVQELHVAMAAKPFAANRVLALLSKAFNLAELWGWRERGSNPTRGIQRYPEPPRQRHLNAREYKRLGAALTQARRERILPDTSLTAVELLLYTGCRPGEIFGLKWDWVDLESRRIRLPKAKGDRPGRTKRGRVIWLNEPALAALHRVERRDDSPYVLEGPRPGQPLKSIKKTWDALCRMASIEGATPYSLRHSFVSEGVPAGVSLELVSDLAGHDDIDITDRVYRSRLDDAQIAAAETMGAHLHELTNGRVQVKEEAR